MIYEERSGVEAIRARPAPLHTTVPSNFLFLSFAEENI